MRQGDWDAKPELIFPPVLLEHRQQAEGREPAELLLPAGWECPSRAGMEVLGEMGWLGSRGDIAVAALPQTHHNKGRLRVLHPNSELCFLSFPARFSNSRPRPADGFLEGLRADAGRKVSDGLCLLVDRPVWSEKTRGSKWGSSGGVSVAQSVMRNFSDRLQGEVEFPSISPCVTAFRISMSAFLPPAHTLSMLRLLPGTAMMSPHCPSCWKSSRCCLRRCTAARCASGPTAAPRSSKTWPTTPALLSHCW